MWSRLPATRSAADPDRERLRDLRADPAQTGSKGRHRRRQPARNDQGRIRIAARSEESDPTARAGSGSDATRRRLFVPGRQPKMTFPLVRDFADDGIPVAVACRVLGFSTQGFYTWKRSPVMQVDWDDAHLINAAYDTHAYTNESAPSQRTSTPRLSASCCRNRCR